MSKFADAALTIFLIVIVVAAFVAFIVPGAIIVSADLYTSAIEQVRELQLARRGG